MSANTCTPSTPPGGTENKDGSIMGSIAALRQILMIDTPTKSMLSEKHTSISLQQSRYEERRKNEGKVVKLEATIAELETELKQVQQESEKERSLRKTLETTYEALSQHKKELVLQLELVSKSREVFEEKFTAKCKSLEAEKASFARERQNWAPQIEKLKEEHQATVQQAGAWKSKFLAAERVSGEQADQVKALKTQVEASKSQHEESVQSHLGKEEQLKKHVQELTAARKESEEVLQKIRKDKERTKKWIATPGASDSSVSVDTFLQDMMENYSAVGEERDAMINEFGSKMQGLKVDLNKLEADKAGLQLQLQATKTSSERASVDLATNREKWRQIRDEMEEMKDELEDSRARVTELERDKEVPEEDSTAELNEKKRANHQEGEEEDDDQESKRMKPDPQGDGDNQESEVMNSDPDSLEI